MVFRFEHPRKGPGWHPLKPTRISRHVPGSGAILRTGAFRFMAYTGQGRPLLIEWSPPPEPTYARQADEAPDDWTF